MGALERDDFLTADVLVKRVDLVGEQGQVAARTTVDAIAQAVVGHEQARRLPTCLLLRRHVWILWHIRPPQRCGLRALRLDRAHLVGGLSLASLAGDAIKTTVFAEAQLISASGYRLAIIAVPLMLIASLAGAGSTERSGNEGLRASSGP